MASIFLSQHMFFSLSHKHSWLFFPNPNQSINCSEKKTNQSKNSNSHHCSKWKPNSNSNSRHCSKGISWNSHYQTWSSYCLRWLQNFPWLMMIYFGCCLSCISISDQFLHFIISITCQNSRRFADTYLYVNGIFLNVYSDPVREVAHLPAVSLEQAVDKWLCIIQPT